MSTTNHWHLRKEVSVGTIITLIVLAVGSVSAWATLKEQVRHKADESSVKVLRSQMSAVQKSLVRIEAMQEEIRDEQRRLSRDIRRSE